MRDHCGGNTNVVCRRNRAGRLPGTTAKRERPIRSLASAEQKLRPCSCPTCNSPYRIVSQNHPDHGTHGFTLSPAMPWPFWRNPVPERHNQFQARCAWSRTDNTIRLSIIFYSLAAGVFGQITRRRWPATGAVYDENWTWRRSHNPTSRAFVFFQHGP